MLFMVVLLSNCTVGSSEQEVLLAMFEQTGSFAAGQFDDGYRKHKIVFPVGGIAPQDHVAGDLPHFLPQGDDPAFFGLLT